MPSASAACEARGRCLRPRPDREKSVLNIDNEHVELGPHEVESEGVLLDLVDICVNFGGIRALSSVSMKARSGEVLGIIGPNGSGKTTLFDVISGVRTPSSGRVLFDSVDVTREPSAVRARRGLRRTFQRVQTFGWLTVEDNLLAALEWRGGGGGFFADVVGWPGRSRRERARRMVTDEVLDRCGLSAVRSEFAGSLPIGVARMVELARAVVDPPRLLLLDEPASGLDETEITCLGAEIQRVRTQTNCAVILIEHNAGFVMDQSDRMIVLDGGEILATGRPSEIQSNPMVQEAYLGRDDSPGDATAETGD